MGKYRTNSKVIQKPKSEGPHAIWRGIGCLMLLIIPVISIAAGIQTVKYGLANQWTIPYQLLGTPSLPDFFYKSTGLMIIFGPILSIQNFYANAVVSIIYMALIGGVISMVYAFTYQAIGPSRYGPTDAPPPKIKTKKYTR
jgi:uncharacterized membrane protein